LVDIFFVDAPNPASGPIPDDVAPYFQGPYFEWWNAQKSADGSWMYENADRSQTFINDIFKLHGPFDGLIGFSQGAAMSALLAGMQRLGKVLLDQPMLRCIVCFAGIRVRDPCLEEAYSAMAPVDSIHIIGEKDPVKHMTNLLIQAFDSPIVIHHPRGHVIPALKGEDLQRLREFLEFHAAEAAL
jgi:hypothetical protein